MNHATAPRIVELHALNPAALNPAHLKPIGALDRLEMAILRVHEATSVLDAATSRVQGPADATGAPPPIADGGPSHLGHLIASLDHAADRLHSLAARIDL